MRPFNSLKGRNVGNKTVLGSVLLIILLGSYLAITHSFRGRVHKERGNYREVSKSDNHLANLLQAGDMAGKAWDAASEGRFDDAGAAAGECLRTDPTNARALYAEGIYQFNRGHYSEAATNFSAASASVPDWQYRNALAIAQIELHDWKRAQAVMLENFAAFPNINILNATCCFGRDQVQAATEKLMQEYPDQAVTRYLHGVTLALAEDVPDGLEQLTRAIQIDPSFAPAFLARAALRDQFADDDGAWQDYAVVLRLEPKLSGPLRKRAEIEAKRGNYALARSDFFTAIKHSNEPAFRSETLVLFAESCLQSRAAADAMTALTAACAETPWKGLPSCSSQGDWTSATENRGILLYSQALEIAETDPAKSLNMFQEAAALAPRWPMPKLGVALESTRLGNFTLAASASAEAIDMEPGLALGWFWKSMALSKLGKEAESLAALQHAEGISTNWTTPCTNHAWREIELGEIAPAATRLTLLLRHFDDAGVLWMRAKARLRLRDDSGALVDLDRSIAVADSPIARIERARIYVARQQKRDAIIDFVAVSRSEGSQELLVAEARKALEEMTKICDNCQGTGHLTRTVTCPECGGSGSHALGRASIGLGKVGVAGMLNNCMRCNGDGWIQESTPCPKCSGLGVVF